MASKKVTSKQTSRKEKTFKPVEDIKFVYALFIAFGIFIFLFSSYKVTGDDDFFWHLATGRYVIENGSVPSTDVFGYATENVQWIPFEWGWDVLTYTLNSIGGYNLILVFRSVIFLLIFYLLFRLLRKFNVNSIIIFLILSVLIFAIIDRLSPRPHIMTYLFLVLTIYIYTSFKYVDRDKYFYMIYFLPVIFLLWSNIHMGVLAGGLLLLVFGIGEILIYYNPGWSKNVKPLTKQQIQKFILICAVCMFTLLLNPHGINTYLYAYEHTQMKLLETVNEWKNPLSSDLGFGFVVTLYKIMLLSGVIILLYAYSRKDLIFALVYIAFAIYSVRAIRLTVDYEIVIAFFLAVAVNYYLLKLRSANQKNSLMNLILYHNVTKVILIVFVLFIASNIPSNKLYEWMRYYRVYGWGINQEFLPVQLFDFMKENNIKGKPFNHFGTGGYLVWNFPDQKNFIDSRNLNDEIFNEYNSILIMRPGFEKKLDSYGVDYILYLDPDLIRRPGDLGKVIVAYAAKNPDKWKLVFWDDKSLLYLRNTLKYQDLINKFEYKTIDPYNIIFNQPAIADHIRTKPELVKKEIDRKLSLEPDGYLINTVIQSNQGIR